MSKVFSNTDYTNAQARAAMLPEIDVANAYLKYSSGAIAYWWAGGRVYDAPGVLVADFALRRWYDNAGVISADTGGFGGRQLYTSSAVFAYNWDTGTFSTAQIFSSTITASTITASRAVVTDGSSVLVHSATTATEIGYVNGVTSAIQTQIDSIYALNYVAQKGWIGVY